MDKVIELGGVVKVVARVVDGGLVRIAQKAEFESEWQKVTISIEDLKVIVNGLEV